MVVMSGKKDKRLPRSLTAMPWRRRIEPDPPAGAAGQSGCGSSSSECDDRVHSFLEEGGDAANAPPKQADDAADPPRRAKYMRYGVPMTRKMIIYETFEDPSFSTIAKAYSIVMMALILLATTCFVLESEATLPGGGLYNTSALRYFESIEFVSVIIFSLEYIVRFVCCPDTSPPWGKLRFVINMHNIIDLLACLPYWVTYIMERMSDTESSGLGFVRVIRLVRVFRVFKVGKYSSGIQMFTGAIARSTQPLSILLFSLLLAVVIISSMAFMAEGDTADSRSKDYDPKLLAFSGVTEGKQLYCFGTIPRCFWWAFVTMTTVGYGDCYPVTNGGKLLAMATMVLGVLILALPITVVGSNFQKMVEMYEEDTSSMREFDSNEDATIDVNELRKFIHAKRKDNALRKDVDLSVHRLMQRYDPQGNGTLSFAEFSALKLDIIDEAAADPHANVRILLKRSNEQAKHIEELKQQLGRIEALLLDGVRPGGGGGRGPARQRPHPAQAQQRAGEAH